MTCPICEKRKPVRFCPAKGEKICAVCCGTEREASIDCPIDCLYLVAAHRYEDEHPRQLPPETPLLDVALPSDIAYMHPQLMASIAFTIAKFCASNPAATDADVSTAIQAFAETYKTLASGIYYERQPAAQVARDLYSAITDSVTEMKQQAARTRFSVLKDSDIFYVSVFLYRMGLLRTNGRPRSRRYIEFLRNQFPEAKELKREENRIIVP